MTTTLRWLIVAAAFLISPVLGNADKRPENITLARMTERIGFDLPLPFFMIHQALKEPPFPEVIWFTDGCTRSMDAPMGFSFLPACHRHDFNYNNFRLQGRFTHKNKARADEQFKNDLRYVCAQTRSQIVCDATANVYYFMVSSFGGSEIDKFPVEDDELETWKIPTKDETSDERAKIKMAPSSF